MNVDKRKVLIGYFGVEDVDDCLDFVNELKYEMEGDLFLCLEKIEEIIEDESYEDFDYELNELMKIKKYWWKLENLRLMLNLMSEVEEIKEVEVKGIK